MNQGTGGGGKQETLLLNEWIVGEVEASDWNALPNTVARYIVNWFQFIGIGIDQATFECDMWYV